MRFAALIPLFASLLTAQTAIARRPIIASASCTTPTGTTFTESWGDSSTSCWTSGPSTCNATWTQTGAGASIIASPGSPSSNTACTSSLQMATGTSSKSLQRALSFGSGATFTVTMYVYPTTTALGGFNAQTLYAPSVASDGTGTNVCNLAWFSDDGTTLKVYAQSSADSAKVAISLNAWHTIILHVQSGAAASYINVDGGSNQTFTANAAAVNFQTVGDLTGQNEAITYAIGYLKVD